MQQKYSLIIPDFCHNQRLDKSLSILLADVSRSQIQKSIKSGYVKINQNTITDTSYKTKENDSILIDIIAENNPALIPNPINLNIIYEDEDIIIINKPSGLTVHPGPKHHQDTLVNALLYHTSNLSNIEDEIRPGIVHRLDKDTSGLMIVAKNNAAHNNIAKQIAEKTLVRKYYALVWGVLRPSSGTINLNISRSRIDRKRMQVSKYDGKNAITHYETEEIFGKGLMSLVSCSLQTGRTHQIRVHMSYVGNSIVGDQIYGHNKRKILASNSQLMDMLLNFKRQSLHSYHLTLMHPKSNQKMSFETEMQSDMKELIEYVKNNLD